MQALISALASPSTPISVLVFVARSVRKRFAKAS
jgi:hypothetical protein